MPTRPALKVYLSPERAAELQALAAKKGLSMSAVARQLIYRWLDIDAVNGTNHANTAMSVQKMPDPYR